MIRYRVIRSSRKSLSLEIGDELEVLVRAPHRACEAYIEAFVQKNSAWLERKLVARRAFLAQHPEPSEAQMQDLMNRARELIPGRVAYFSQIMGVVPREIRYTRNRTRVGSCTGCNKISFSCRLMGYPPEVLDYVVVHELAHITHKNHGPHFWAVVASVLPNYRVLRKMLRE